MVTIVGTSTAIAISIVTVPLYITAIGLERYGVLAVVWTILTYFGLVELGVSGAMVQRLAGGLLSARQKISLYWTGFSMNLAMGLAGALLLWLSFNPILSALSFSTVEVGNETRSAGGLIAALVLVMTLRSVNNSVLFGAERFVAATILSTLESAASAVAPLVVAIYFSADIYWLIAAILVVRIAFVVASFVVMIPSLPGFKVVGGHLSQARDLLSIGIWYWLAGLIAPLLTYLDRFLIGSVVGVAQLPYYTVPQTILQQSSHIPRALGSVLFPRFSALKDDDAARKLAVDAMEAMAFVVTPISVVLILAMEPLLSIWLSADFAGRSTEVGVVIMFSLLPSSMARILGSQLNGRNRPDLMVKALLLELAPYAFGLYFLSTAFGLIGVALVWTLRVIVDALLLGAMSKVLGSMLKELLFPMALTTASLLASLSWGMHDPKRWVAAAAILLLVVGWTMWFLPPSLARSVGRAPVLRYLRLGRLYRIR